MSFLSFLLELHAVTLSPKPPSKTPSSIVTILENFEQPIQMKVQRQLILKLAENLDNMNSECFKLKYFIKQKLKLKKE